MAGTKMGLFSRIRLAAMVMSNAGYGYNVTRTDRTRRAFSFLSGVMASADRHLSSHTLNQLRENCRMHDREGSLFAGLLNRGLDNIFGSNFDFIPTTGESGLNNRVKDYITLRMRAINCDASGKDDFAELARLALRSVWRDGDCLLVKRKDGTILPFEAEQIVSPKNSAATGKRIVLGVELNDVNRPIAYHIKQRKTRGDYGMTEQNGSIERIEARWAIMPAVRSRFHQTRGVPFLATALAMYNRLHNYIDYESLAALGNAMLAYKIQKEATDTDMAGVESNEDSTTNSTFDKIQHLEPLQVIELLPGEDVDVFGANRPGSNFANYVIICLRIVGAAVGMPLELLLLDFSKTNYSSARAALGEARRSFRVWQKFAAEKICIPWYKWQIARGIATGKLPAKPNIYKARCQWPAWDYIDPQKEAMGNKISIETGVKSISECIRERGGEPDEVFVERAEEKRRMIELGLMTGPRKSKKDQDDAV